MAGAGSKFGTPLLTSALLAVAILVQAAGVAAPAVAAPATAVQAQSPTLDTFKATLSKFGQFIYSERYGNVWQPTSLPAGWHPYPACHWIYDRSFGWTYDDATAWGKIVHHYGRWANDGQAGWVWIPGTEWSPAWVIWRSGGEWTGWAPTPPNSDQQEVTLASFNADKQWTFIETAKLGNRCDAEPKAVPSAAFSSSAPVTAVKVVRGIAVYALPAPAIVVDYEAGPISPWTPQFLGEWLLWLNTASAASVTLGGVCTPAAVPASAPYVSTPPPPPQPVQKNRKRRAAKQNSRPPQPRPQPLIVEEGPAYDPPAYVDPPIRRRPPPDWGPGPIIHGTPSGRPGSDRPRPVATPQSYPNRPVYPRRPRVMPGPYGEPVIR